MVLAWNPREAVALSGKCNNAIIRRFDFGRYFRPCGMGTTREHANGWRGTRGEVEEGISTRIKRTDGRLSRQRATSAIKPSRAVCKSTHCLDPKWHGVAGLVALSRALARPRLFCLIPRMTRLDASARVTLAFHDCLPDLFSLSFYSFRFFFLPCFAFLFSWKMISRGFYATWVFYDTGWRCWSRDLCFWPRIRFLGLA